MFRPNISTSFDGILTAKSMHEASVSYAKSVEHHFILRIPCTKSSDNKWKDDHICVAFVQEGLLSALIFLGFCFGSHGESIFTIIEEDGYINDGCFIPLIMHYVRSKPWNITENMFIWGHFSVPYGIMDLIDH